LTLDDVNTTKTDRQYITKNPFILAIYHEWHQLFKQYLPSLPGLMRKIEFGPGFIQEILPRVITTGTGLLPFMIFHVMLCISHFIHKRSGLL